MKIVGQAFVHEKKKVDFLKILFLKFFGMCLWPNKSG